jgi:tetratricopeptide (TPR) repeat protein
VKRAITNLLVLALVSLVALAAPAHAKAADENDARARAHYKQGMIHYGLGEYEKAITEFKAAYAASQAPRLLFNIAQTYRLKKDYGDAATFYANYLRLMPDAPNRADVERLIAEMQAAQRDEDARRAADAERRRREEDAARAAADARLATEARVAADARLAAELRAANERAAAGAPARPSRPFYKKWWFWTIVGGVAVAGATAAVVATVGDRGVVPAGNLGTIDARHP